MNSVKDHNGMPLAIGTLVRADDMTRAGQAGVIVGMRDPGPHGAPGIAIVDVAFPDGAVMSFAHVWVEAVS